MPRRQRGTRGRSRRGNHEARRPHYEPLWSTCLCRRHFLALPRLPPCLSRPPSSWRVAHARSSCRSCDPRRAADRDRVGRRSRRSRSRLVLVMTWRGMHRGGVSWPEELVAHCVDSPTRHCWSRSRISSSAGSFASPAPGWVAAIIGRSATATLPADGPARLSWSNGRTDCSRRFSFSPLSPSPSSRGAREAREPRVWARWRAARGAPGVARDRGGAPRRRHREARQPAVCDGRAWLVA